MKEFKTVTDFLREIGFSCKGRQGQYSYVDHEKRKVFFGIDRKNNSKNLILSIDWEYDHSRKTKSGKSYKRGNYTTSLNNIRLVQCEGYQLIACEIETKQVDGITTKSTLFDIENLRSYKIREVDGSYFVE